MTNYILQVLMAGIALLQLVKDWGAHKTSSRRVLALCLIVLFASFSAYNTYTTNIKTAKQHNEDQAHITKLQATVDAVNRAQADNTGQFLGQFQTLSDKVAQLQTQVKTEGLREQARKLQAELEATQKALKPPKAVLTFSFDNPNVRTSTNDILTEKSVTPVGNTIHVEVTVVNNSSADALDGELTMRICDRCKFTKESPGALKRDPRVDTERNFTFNHILAMTVIPIPLDFEAPPDLSIINLGLAYRCRTCIVSNFKDNMLTLTLKRF